MLTSTTRILASLVAIQSFAAVLAQKVPRASDENTDEYPQVILGPEGSGPLTIEYQLNHVALNVKNFTRSLKFYTHVFGMRLITTIQVTEQFSSFSSSTADILVKHRSNTC